MYDTCYFILLWKIPHKWPKKDRHHDAVNDTCDNTSLVKCLQTFAQKKVQYHNAVNDTRDLILFWEYPTETIKKARYHDAVYDTCHFILVWKIPQKWPKKARYHDAVYDKCYFILLWKIPHKWPKKDRYHDAVNDTCDNTSLVKCLQTFATELDAIMCLMSKTEQFEFRTIKCHIETLFKSFCV